MIISSIAVDIFISIQYSQANRINKVSEYREFLNDEYPDKFFTNKEVITKKSFLYLKEVKKNINEDQNNHHSISTTSNKTKTTFSGKSRNTRYNQNDYYTVDISNLCHNHDYHSNDHHHSNYHYDGYHSSDYHFGGYDGCHSGGHDGGFFGGGDCGGCDGGCGGDYRNLLKEIARHNQTLSKHLEFKFVIIGRQSDGKSSTVESLTGIKLPQGDGKAVTLCPIKIMLRRLKPEEEEEYADIKFENEYLCKFKNPAKGIKVFNISDTIDEFQESLKKLKGVGEDETKLFDEVIQVEIYRKNIQNFTLYDLPGITIKNEDLEKQSQAISEKYLSNKEVTVLCVISASEDLDNSSMVRYINDRKNHIPDYQDRVIPVITKVDLIDESKLNKFVEQLDELNLKRKKSFIINKDISDRDDILEKKISQIHSLKNELSINTINKGVNELIEYIMEIQKKNVDKIFDNMEIDKNIDDELFICNEKLNQSREFDNMDDVNNELYELIGKFYESLKSKMNILDDDDDDDDDDGDGEDEDDDEDEDEDEKGNENKGDDIDRGNDNHDNNENPDNQNENHQDSNNTNTTNNSHTKNKKKTVNSPSWNNRKKESVQRDEKHLLYYYLDKKFREYIKETKMKVNELFKMKFCKKVTKNIIEHNLENIEILEDTVPFNLLLRSELKKILEKWDLFILDINDYMKKEINELINKTFENYPELNVKIQELFNEFDSMQYNEVGKLVKRIKNIEKSTILTYNPDVRDKVNYLNKEVNSYLLKDSLQKKQRQEGQPLEGPESSFNYVKEVTENKILGKKVKDNFKSISENTGKLIDINADYDNQKEKKETEYDVYKGRIKIGCFPEDITAYNEKIINHDHDEISLNEFEFVPGFQYIKKEALDRFKKNIAQEKIQLKTANVITKMIAYLEIMLNRELDMLCLNVRVFLYDNLTNESMIDFIKSKFSTLTFEEGKELLGNTLKEEEKKRYTEKMNQLKEAKDRLNKLKRNRYKDY
ncbi:hypothetical protein PIROE2DRAFT_64964 [Piromyces sp. E2]|nr:hypothetical protein PIROE2DRAFT_64964 [Piromyces sp. E2]|eukprot:OUM57513.1 hypothetical protein PIROE2DRAFT_64964 [Piromyces sp. E2]